jgi:DNA-binding response OmpR family regulator
VRYAQEPWEAELVLEARPPDVAVLRVDSRFEGAIDMLRRHGAGGRPPFVLLVDTHDLVQTVLGLEMGAADVVAATIAPRELAARIAGLLARIGADRHEMIVLERSTVDLKAALVLHASGAVEQLSAGQVALLRLFAGAPGVALSRDQIIAAAPAETSDAFDRSIDSRIVRLRRKLDTVSIVTVRGSGYRFDPPHANGAP